MTPNFRPTWFCALRPTLGDLVLSEITQASSDLAPPPPPALPRMQQALRKCLLIDVSLQARERPSPCRVVVGEGLQTENVITDFKIGNLCSLEQTP